MTRKTINVESPRIASQAISILLVLSLMFSVGMATVAAQTTPTTDWTNTAGSNQDGIDSAYDSSGNAYFAFENETNDQLVIYKVDPSGNIEWTQPISNSEYNIDPSSNDYLTVTEDNRLYTVAPASDDDLMAWELNTSDGSVENSQQVASSSYSNSHVYIGSAVDTSGDPILHVAYSDIGGGGAHEIHSQSLTQQGIANALGVEPGQLSTNQTHALVSADPEGNNDGETFIFDSSGTEVASFNADSPVLENVLTDDGGIFTIATNDRILEYDSSGTELQEEFYTSVGGADLIYASDRDELMTLTGASPSGATIGFINTSDLSVSEEFSPISVNIDGTDRPVDAGYSEISNGNYLGAAGSYPGMIQWSDPGITPTPSPSPTPSPTLTATDTPPSGGFGDQSWDNWGNLSMGERTALIFSDFTILYLFASTLIAMIMTVKAKSIPIGLVTLAFMTGMGWILGFVPNYVALTLFMFFVFFAYLSEQIFTDPTST